MQKINSTSFKNIFISLLLMLFISGHGQERVISKSSRNRDKPTFNVNSQTNSRAEANFHNILTKDNNKLFSKSEIDTLNFPLAGDYSIYVSDEGGYVSGNNSYDDKAKANYFTINETKKITGVLIDFAIATGTSDIELSIWDNSGTNGSPGTEIFSEAISITQIKEDVQNNHTTFVGFENPVMVNDNFYAGVKLPSIAGDTIVVWTNTDGDSNPPTAWDLWSDNSWNRYDDSWGLLLSHAIFPIVDNEIGLSANFTSNSTNIQPGQNIEYSDNSSGNPVSWEWTFEGGEPATSAEQNPTVLYVNAGSFNVSLKISDTISSDSITKENYVLVTEAPEPQIDTLNFPLEGDFGLYVYNPPNSGYVTGTNSYNDLAKANYFNNNVELKVISILFDFAIAQGTSDNIEFVIWDNNGDGNSPGSELASVTVPFSSIIDDVNNQQLSLVELNSPLIIDHSFYAGVFLPLESNDELAIWSNTDGDTNPGTAWELWEDNEWYDMSLLPAIEINLALGIHPIVDYNVGIINNNEKRHVNIFPNPTESIVYLETGILSKDAQIRIYNSAGVLVYESSVNSYDQYNRVDLTGFENGMYIISVTSGQETFYNKVIKN